MLKSRQTLLAAGLEVGLGKRPLRELSVGQLLAIRRNAYSKPCPWVKGPQDAVRREVKPVDQVSCAVDPQHTFKVQRAVVLKNSTTTGVIVIRVV